MINLLPPELKTGYRYARRNVALRKWVAIFVIALVGLGALATYGALSIHQSTVDLQKQVAAVDTVAAKKEFDNTQKQIKDIGDSFKLVVKVLGQEVLFSQLLKQVATVIPANANLTGLTISQTQGAIDIAAVTTDYNTGTQLQVNLSDTKNKIFSKADIVSISCNPASATNAEYPCAVSIRALFSANNPYLFINSKGTK